MTANSKRKSEKVPPVIPLFITEITRRTGQLKASSLDRITCVAVAGVVAEYLNFGHSEGGLNDILQLDQLMRSLKVRS